MLLHELPVRTAARSPEAIALSHRSERLSYPDFAIQIETFAAALVGTGRLRQERVAIFLPKQFASVVAMFGAARAGCVFVPINPVLKPAQVEHILRDCNVRVLVTSLERSRELAEYLTRCPDLQQLIAVDAENADIEKAQAIETRTWAEFLDNGAAATMHRVIDADMAAILYTSGSTGKPKGVVLSHRNMVAGAESVAQYLENCSSDRLLAVLPFSFDYGFSQLSTAFCTGASVVLLDHLFARDVVNAVAKEKITGLAAVPTLWSQLAELNWPDVAKHSLRYITNSGGAMPQVVLQKLRASLPKTKPYLMYGLTEAFRSTYLPPNSIDQRPGSIGKAIPNVEILVVRPDGSECATKEPGELVHRGPLVALGYWNDLEKTNERFRPLPHQPSELKLRETAVWSGDIVRRDADGFLYFIGRRDAMIKTSGYRVSPTEIEEVIFATGLVSDAAALGIPHPSLGQAIVVVASVAPNRKPDSEILLNECRNLLPNYMVPLRIEWRESLPKNPNGKIDRSRLASEMATELKDISADAT
jgi:acyl-CoA ligase (AMP-forming) (exosortase A-associated)